MLLFMLDSLISILILILILTPGENNVIYSQN